MTATQVQTLLASVKGDTPSQKAESLAAELTAISPELPAEATSVLMIASMCLQAISSADQALRGGESNTGEQFQACVSGALAKVQSDLDQVFDSANGVVTKPRLNYPNPPWLPQATSVTVTYTANCSFPPSGAAQGLFFYLLPFGGFEMPGAQSDWPRISTPRYPGGLYLGLSKAGAAQTLNFLFQMASGDVTTPPQVVWQYPTSGAHGEWTSFKDTQEPSDTTGGLQHTGVLSLIVPAQPAPASASTTGLRWFRAVTGVDGQLSAPGLFPETIGIYLNPILADRVNTSPDAPTTPANTIRIPTQKVTGVGNINQPLDSFGGRPEEAEIQFQTRPAERLRHKDRAILPWDYKGLSYRRSPQSGKWPHCRLPAFCLTSRAFLRIPAMY